MKLPALPILTATGLTFILVTNTHAIERLKIAVNCPDVVLSWPSIEGETYIVQHRQTLDTNTPWTTLTNKLPAAFGTNITLFVHTNRVECLPGGAPGGTNAPPRPPPMPGSTIKCLCGHEAVWR